MNRQTRVKTLHSRNLVGGRSQWVMVPVPVSDQCEHFYILLFLHLTIHWRIQGGRQGRAPRVQILSFSCSFQKKIRIIIPLWELAPAPSRKILDPPLLYFLFGPCTSTGVRYPVQCELYLFRFMDAINHTNIYN